MSSSNRSSTRSSNNNNNNNNRTSDNHNDNNNNNNNNQNENENENDDNNSNIINRNNNNNNNNNTTTTTTTSKEEELDKHLNIGRTLFYDGNDKNAINEFLKCLIIQESIKGRYDIITQFIYYCLRESYYFNNDYDNANIVHHVRDRIWIYNNFITTDQIETEIETTTVTTNATNNTNISLYILNEYIPQDMKNELQEQYVLKTENEIQYYLLNLIQSTLYEKLGDIYRNYGKYIIAIKYYKLAILIEEQNLICITITLPYLYRKIAYIIFLCYILQTSNHHTTFISSYNNNNIKKDDQKTTKKYNFQYHIMDCIDVEYNIKIRNQIIDNIYCDIQKILGLFGTSFININSKHNNNNNYYSTNDNTSNTNITRTSTSSTNRIVSQYINEYNQLDQIHNAIHIGDIYHTKHNYCMALQYYQKICDTSIHQKQIQYGEVVYQYLFCNTNNNDNINSSTSSSSTTTTTTTTASTAAPATAHNNSNHVRSSSSSRTSNNTTNIQQQQQQQQQPPPSTLLSNENIILEIGPLELLRRNI